MLPKQNVNKITFCDCFDLAVIATNSDNDCVAVSQLTSVSSVQPILDQYKNFKKKDFAVFAVDLSKADLSAVKYLYENTSLTKIYTFDNYPLPSVERYLASKGVTVVKYLNTYGNSVVLSINKSVGESAYRIRTDTVSALFDLEYEARYGNLSSNEREVDVVFSKYNAEKAVSFFPSSAVVSYFCPENDNVFSIRQEGTFTLK